MFLGLLINLQPSKCWPLFAWVLVWCLTPFPFSFYCTSSWTTCEHFLCVFAFSGPRLYGDKLQYRFISPRNRKVQRRLVMLHDFFRTKVEPPAANMLSMVRKVLCVVLGRLAIQLVRFIVYMWAIADNDGRWSNILSSSMSHLNRIKCNLF